MSNVISMLKKLGCKVEDREKSLGANKWWLSYHREGPDLAQIKAEILTLLGFDPNPYNTSYWHEYRGSDFSMTFQTHANEGHRGVFVAKYVRNRTGELYRHGIDC